MASRDPQPSSSPAGGGFFFVSALILGIIAGIIFRQPTIGFLAGAGVGAVILLAMWLRTRR